MAIRESMPVVPAPRRGGTVSFTREYLIRMGLVRPALAASGVVKATSVKLARLVQGGRHG